MAVGDAGAFLATLALIVLAMQRMRHTRERADVAESRPRLPPTRSRLCVRRPPRTPSGGSSTRRTRGRTSTGSRDADKQTRAPGTLARATRNAPRAQLQPVVFAHAHSAPVSGPRRRVRRQRGSLRRAALPDQRGHGLALDIDSGIALGGVGYAFGGGMRFRAARPRESIPTAGPDATRGPPTAPSCPRSLGRQAFADARRAREEPVDWCRFSNVFGERFET